MTTAPEAWGGKKKTGAGFIMGKVLRSFFQSRKLMKKNKGKKWARLSGRTGATSPSEKAKLPHS